MSDVVQGATSPVVDAHHHLWRYSAEEYDWIDDRMVELRRDFTAAELRGEMSSAEVDLTVAVQARQSLEETKFLLVQAEACQQIGGVVGWLPLRDAGQLSQSLELFGQHPLLVGARHVLQAEAPGFLEDAAWHHGIAALTGAGLTYDLLLRADQLQEGARFVDRHPNQRFVLDHLAKPRIADGVLEPWTRDLRELAKREHVWCKVSGMVTEADWQQWSLEGLRPYLDIAVEAFTPRRLMAGSDWPVCLLASTYGRWWSALREYLAAFRPAERD